MFMQNTEGRKEGRIFNHLNHAKNRTNDYIAYYICDREMNTTTTEQWNSCRVVEFTDFIKANSFE